MRHDRDTTPKRRPLGLRLLPFAAGGGALCALILLVSSTAQQPPQIEGSLSNFDVWNRTVFIANDFEVFLDGIVPGSICDVYNGAFNPFSPPDASVTQEGSGTVIRWGPPEDGSQVNPGGMGHFGFQIKGNLQPLGTIFRWSQNGEPLGPRVKTDGLVWNAAPAGNGGDGGVVKPDEREDSGGFEGAPRNARMLAIEGTVPNRSTSDTYWVQRRINTSSNKVTLDDLLVGEPLEQSATLLDPRPIPIAPGDELTHVFTLPAGNFAVMIVDFYDSDPDGNIGEIQGTWLDAANAGF